MKGQSGRQKQNVLQTTVCLLHERTFSSFDVKITVNISRAASNKCFCVMYALCTTVNVVYRCNCYVPVCSVLQYATVSVLCIVQYYLYIVVLYH